MDTGADDSGLAGGCERHGHVQRHDLYFFGPGTTRRHWLWSTVIVYVPYSGYVGDCGNYHGWVVGVDINNPANVHGLGYDSHGWRYLGTRRRRQ